MRVHRLRRRTAQSIIISSSASADVSLNVIPPPPPPEAPIAITLDVAAKGQWSGESGDVGAPITALWGIADHVFALGSGVILYSSDSGTHFESAPAPVEPRGNVEGYGQAIWGPSADEVYVGGETVVRSRDGGRTWSTSAVFAGRTTTSLWGSSAEDVYAVGQAKDYSSRNTSGPFIAKTSDHGSSWQIVYECPECSLYRVAGTGPKDVYVAGYENGLRKRALFHSGDGGKTWSVSSPILLHPEGVPVLHDMCIWGQGTLFLSTTINAHTGAAGIFASRDSGKTLEARALREVHHQWLGLRGQAHSGFNPDRKRRHARAVPGRRHHLDDSHRSRERREPSRMAARRARERERRRLLGRKPLCAGQQARHTLPRAHRKETFEAA